MQVRTATTQDADAITDHWVALADGQRAHGSHILPEENRGVARDDVLRHIVADELAVAVEDGSILGFVMYTVETTEFEQDVTRGLVRNIYVRPADRSRGVGTALLNAAEARLGDRDVDMIALEVMADNDAARRFYRRHGYDPHRIGLEKSTESDTL